MLTIVFLTEEALVGRVWNMSRLKAFIFLRMDWVTKGLFLHDELIPH